MNPIGKTYLFRDGNDEERIGSFERNERYTDTEHLEMMIEELCPLSVTCDVRQIHPPYFTEFCYMDVFGGLNLHTLSAEITCRVMEKAIEHPAVRKPKLDEVMDKYFLDTSTFYPEKVVFLAGCNSMNMLDQSILQRVMQDPQWYIKPHPITSEEVLKDLAKIFGYGRMIGPDQSGMALLRHAKEVAAMQTSELYVLARYLGKPVIDLTRFDRAWLATYHYIIRLFDNTDNDREVVERCFGSPYSGHLRPEYSDSDNQALISAYYELAMAERETFKLITNQRLAVEDRTITDWL